MRTIHRDIVGGFIFSKDGKVLLGKNRKGGVYQDSFVVPGGGVDDGETKEQALRREMLEETGIDIRDETVIFARESNGESEKVLRDMGERVLVKMSFYDYEIALKKNAGEMVVKAEDDWGSPQWFLPSELITVRLIPPTKSSLEEMGFYPTAEEK